MSSEPVVQNQPLITATDQTSTPKEQTPAEPEAVPTTVTSIGQNSSILPAESNGQSIPVPTDNGIFDFMTPERAIELYKRLHSEGKLDLKWKFHGRKSLNDSKNNASADHDEETNADSKESNQDQTVNTEFDFDDEFTAMDDETSTGESLQLQKRPEAGTEKRTNLSDIMNDIRKEITQENDEVLEPSGEGT